jgi:hypothetical protein
VTLSYKFITICILHVKFYYSYSLVLNSSFSCLMWAAVFTGYTVTMHIVIFLKLLSNNYSIFTSFHL